MSVRPDCVVVTPPPTPNGDLHVGHLCGPYLAADVYTRFERLRGRTVVSAISTDENQSYVVTTAERLGREPRELAAESHESIRRTFERASILFDVIGRPDERYASFVGGYLDRLAAADAFARAEVEMLFDTRTGRVLVESFVSGRCPMCFRHTCGNICESCGHPNDPAHLLDPDVVGGGGIRTARDRALVLPLERYRAELERYCSGHRFRPSLQVLLESLLEDRLPDFPVTYRCAWGLPAHVPGLGPAVYNVWAEMYPGHLHWSSTHRPAAGRDAWWEDADRVRYVQFIGFDNSFFYAVAHVALAHAARAAGLPGPLPDHIVTNQFYLLEGSKFSTSQGHLIWARDLLDTWATDPVRLYLCLSNPESQESNFAVREMEETLEAQLARPFERLRGAWNRLVSEGRVETVSAGDWGRRHEALRRRFERSYDPPTFSLRRAAATLVACLDLVAAEVERAEVEGRPALASALGHLALYATPLMPTFASGLAAAAGLRDGLTWTTPIAPRREELGPISPHLLALRRDSAPAGR